MNFIGRPLSLRRALIAAAAAHALAWPLVSGRRSPAPVPIDARADGIALTIDVTRDESEPPSEEPVATAAPQPVASRPSPTTAARARGGGAAPVDPSRAAALPATASTEPDGADEVVAGAGSDERAPTGGSPAVDVLGAARSLAFGSAVAAGPAQGEPRVRPYPTSRTGGLVEALDQADRQNGLGRGGPVLTAVEEVARIPGESPPEGQATYEVIVAKSGPARASLLAAKSDHAAWESLTDKIAAMVSARNVSIPSSSAGMRFVIRVDAVVAWPDGKRPSQIGTKTIATTGGIGVSESHPGLDFARVPMVGAYRTGKVCSAGIVVTPGMLMLGGACSPENVGQPATRVVHGRIVDEARL